MASHSDDPHPTADLRPGLTTGGRSGGLDRAVLDDLATIRAQGLLAHQDASAELAGEIERSLAAPLALSEINGALDRLDGLTLPSFAELEQLVTSTDSASMAIEGNLLARLLEDGGQARSILKSGLALLKHHRYREAIEWWTLNRRGLNPATSRLHLLVLIMESLTHLWAGDPDRAATVRAQIRVHPLMPKTQP